MRKRRKPLPVPQWEFGFSTDTFNLIQESAVDGERLIRERREVGRAKEKAEAAQPQFFPKK